MRNQSNNTSAKMALTFQQIILDAGKLVNDLTQQENTADVLICEIQSVCNQIDSMKQYQEDLETLNSQASNQKRQEIIAGFQKGNNNYFRELRAENKDLRLALEDYQKAMEQIMSKYRQQTAYFLKQTKQNYTALPNSCPVNSQNKCLQVIAAQADKINEMASVMRRASEMGEEMEMSHIEMLSQLKLENEELRGLLEISNQYYHPKLQNDIDNKNGHKCCKDIQTCSKLVQTEPNIVVKQDDINLDPCDTSDASTVSEPEYPNKDYEVYDSIFGVKWTKEEKDEELNKDLKEEKNKEQKNEIKDEIKSELKDELKIEIKDEMKSESKEELQDKKEVLEKE
uniref:F-BAR domain-containing protein n=1 Tax=Trichogramma kaykai TaxID=54128 RepID=A0ABD2W7E1_9HYME